jgi:tRNA/rRNA methyltransferase
MPFTDKTSPAIILVSPQMGENIGASARAIANFSLETLHLVSPRDGWPNKVAEANSVGAFDMINSIEVFESTADAIKEYHTVYATTARPRDMRKSVMTPESAITDMHERHAKGQRTAILFGGERAGLTNEDISLAQHIISVPVNPDFSSLNLSQSVLLMAYEWRRQADDTPQNIIPEGDSPEANQGEVIELIERLENELEAHNFFREANMRPTMMRNIRNIFTRNNMSEQETKTFHGIISALIGNKVKKL